MSSNPARDILDNANEIKHDHSPVVIVVLGPIYDCNHTRPGILIAAV